MYAEERQQLLAQRLSAEGRLSVQQVAEEFDVSSETIRRDLAVLASAGLAQRVHGGAVAARPLSMVESDLAERATEHPDEKARIAKAALNYLPAAGGSIALDAGTTIEQFVAAFAPDTRLTALTHAIPIAAQLMHFEDVDLHVIGGRVRGITAAAIGRPALDGYAATRVDVAFIGTNGMSAGHGLSTHDSAEAAVKDALIASGRLVVALFDASKFGLSQVFSFASYTDIDVVITSAGAPAAEIEALNEAGVEVVIA